MATRKTPPAPPAPATLTLEQTRAAISKLQRRLTEIEQFPISSIRDFDDGPSLTLATKVDAALNDVFGHASQEAVQTRVGRFAAPVLRWGGTPPPSVQEVQEAYKRGMERTCAKLRALIEVMQERLLEAESAGAGAAPLEAPEERNPSRKVFVVHGHDDGTKETVARLLQKLHLTPIILHEQVSGSQTIIEKFEKHSVDVDFAVVLFTPDDVGHAKGNPDGAKPRPRQNVVLELGYFIGLLGRAKVCVLLAGGMEMPSDIQGVIYTPIDQAGSWRYQLAKEIRAAGIAIDMNDA